MASDKGPNFEREVCRQLSLWWSYGVYDDLFWRNRTRSTRFSKRMEFQDGGDITAMRPEGQDFINTFSIECKTGYSKTKKGSRVRNIPWDLLDCVDSSRDKKIENTMILQFWEQALSATLDNKKIPILIAKRDFHSPLISFTCDDWAKITEYIGDPLISKIKLELTIKSKGDDGEEVGFRFMSFVFFSLDQFISYYDPETFAYFIKNHQEETMVLNRRKR